jgi:hypothetical protein
MNTKIRFLALLTALPFLFVSQSCEKIKDEINKVAAFDHNFDIPIQTFTLDSNNFKSSEAVLEWTPMYSYGVSVDLQQVLDDNDLSSADFTDGSFTSFNVTIIAPAGVTFSFVDQMRIGVSLSGNFDPMAIVATTETIDPGATSVTFNIEQVDITPYIEAETFYVRLEGFKVTNLPTSSVTFNLDGKAVITVEPL